MHRSSSFRACVALGACALAVSLVPSSAMAASPRKDAGYQGASNQLSGDLTLPVALRVSQSGTSVARFDIQWTSKCASPTGRKAIGGLSVTKTKPPAAPPLPISREGSFGNVQTFTQDFGNNTKGLFTVTLKGKFTKKTQASGSFRVAVSIRDAANTQTDTCDTGNITWKVRD